MRSILLLVLVALAGLGDATAQAPSRTCLRYGPDTVTIEGPVFSRTYPGPPNYESITQGDAPERGFYLRLEAPICVATGGDEALMPAMTGVRDIQLITDTTGERWLRRQNQTAVSVRGTLNPAVSGHHHVPLILTVTSYADSNRPSDARLLDSAAKAMRIGSLRATAMRDGHREVRIWYIGGIVLPNSLVRLKGDGVQADGEIFAFWPDDRGNQDKEERANYLSGLRRMVVCVKRYTAAGIIACRQPGVSADRWRATSDSLDALEACSLVDESDLPPTDEFTLDGFTLVVECRMGSTYRSYKYVSPAPARGPEYARAETIWRLSRALSPPLMLLPSDTMSSRPK